MFTIAAGAGKIYFNHHMENIRLGWYKKKCMQTSLFYEMIKKEANEMDCFLLRKDTRIS